jgi:hypothetical protein
MAAAESPPSNAAHADCSKSGLGEVLMVASIREKKRPRVV